MCGLRTQAIPYNVGSRTFNRHFAADIRSNVGVEYTRVEGVEGCRGSGGRLVCVCTTGKLHGALIKRNLGPHKASLIISLYPVCY